MGTVLTPCLSYAETIKIGGTGASLGTMRLLATEFAKVSPGDNVVIVPSLGTTGGMKAVVDGVIDLAVATRGVTPAEAAQGVAAVEYGRTPFVVATSPNGTDAVSSLSELADIYAGRKTTWSSGTPIRLILRPAFDTDMKLLGGFSPDLNAAVASAMAKPGMIVAATDQDAADAIEKTRGAIGTTTLALVLTERRDVVLVPINGTIPSAEALESGRYRHHKTFYLARKSTGSAASARFLDFVISPIGRQILTGAGHVVSSQ